MPGAVEPAPVFGGFPPEAFTFFEQLAANNEREWFHANKKAYERSCREPMKELIVALGSNPKRARLSRINRDLRFAPNRRPYRTYLAAGVRGAYIQLSANGLWVGAGLYRPKGGALRAFRTAIDDDGPGRALEAVVATLRDQGYGVDTHDLLKTAPRGYPRDHPRIELLRMKDIVAGRPFPPEECGEGRELVAGVERVMADVTPLAEWVRRHVGEGR